MAIFKKMILAKIIKISKIELFAQVQKDALAVRKGGGQTGRYESVGFKQEKAA